MMEVLSVVTWLPITRPRVSSTTFLCSLKAARVSNVDGKEAGGVGVEGIIGDIAK